MSAAALAGLALEEVDEEVLKEKGFTRPPEMVERKKELAKLLLRRGVDVPLGDDESSGGDCCD